MFCTSPADTAAGKYFGELLFPIISCPWLEMSNQIILPSVYHFFCLSKTDGNSSSFSDSCEAMTNCVAGFILNNSWTHCMNSSIHRVDLLPSARCFTRNISVPVIRCEKHNMCFVSMATALIVCCHIYRDNNTGPQGWGSDVKFQ